MSALSSAIHNTGHYHVQPRPACLSPCCARIANDRRNRGSSGVLASLDLVPRDAPTVDKDPAYRLHRIYAESARGVLCPAFCPMAVWRRIAQDRRGADHRPLDSRIKGARCAAVDRETVQRLIAIFLAWTHIARSRVLLCAQEVSAMCWRRRPDLVVDEPISARQGAAGPADAGQGSRCARPAPPADGLDRRRLARRLTAMR